MPLIVDADVIIQGERAQEHGSAVATFNKRHFQAIPGLKVVEPRFN